MPIINVYHPMLCIAILWGGLASASASAMPEIDQPPPCGCEMAYQRVQTQRTSTTYNKLTFPPAQLEIRTPFEPTAFQSSGRNYLFYELYLQNFTSTPLTLRGIQVINADKTTQELIAEFNAKQLDALLVPIGVDKVDDNHQLGAGQSIVAFLCVAFDGKTQVPRKLRHLILLDAAVAEGPVIGTHHTKLQVLGRPLVGTNWTAIDAPSISSHHRTGLLVAGGLAQISRRYAIDWKIIKQGSSFSGDARDVHSYYAYGKKVLAVADGTVVATIDNLPDNAPRTAAGFSPAVPITMKTVAGNSIILALGEGQFAYYAHLQRGSLRVKVGDHVRRGQLLGRIGNSGDAREPHLHFQVTTAPDILTSEGVPYLIDHYRVKTESGGWEARTREFPLGNIVVDFGPDTRGTKK